MNAIARTIRTRIPLFSFTSRGFLSFLLVLGLLFVIFFLPDLLGLHAARGPVEESTVVPEVVNRIKSPLNEILDQLNQAGTRKPFQPSVREAANTAIQSSPAITWDVIRSEPVKQAIAQARTQIGEILQLVPAEKTFSRFALANYQLALDQLSSARDDRFRAVDALGYLRYLDRQVSERFSEEGVDGAALKRWSEVTLGDALKSGEQRIYRESGVTPFDPQFALNYINVKVPADGKPAPNAEFAPTSSITIEGSILFRGVKSIKVYHNRKFVKDLPVPRPSKHSNDPVVFFKTTIEAASGVFSFRVESEDGEVLIKEYSFYPQLLQVINRNPFGQYAIGRGHERTLAFDRKFLRSVSRPNSEQDGMVPF